MKERDERIEKLESSVAMLQQHVHNLKHVNTQKLDDLEQYGRLLCLRIEGISSKEEENSDEVYEIVKENIKELCIDRIAKS